MAASSGAIRAGRAFVEIFADDTMLRRNLKSIQGRMSRAAGTIRGIGAQMAGVGLAIGAPLVTAIKLASDAQETFNKFGAVFRDQTTAADDFAKKLSGETGRSIHDIRDAMAAFASSAVGLGYDRSEARQMSEDLTALAIDMASFHNLDTDDAFNRIRSAMAGSSEVLDRFGINIRASALATKGITSSSSEAEKAMARLQIIAETLGAQGALGDAARTSDQFANSAKGLEAAVKDMAVEIGSTLLPAAVAVVRAMKPVVVAAGEFARKNPELVQSIAAVAAGAVVLGPALFAVGQGLSVVTSAAGVALGAMTMLTGPFGLVGVAAAGLAASVVDSSDIVGSAWERIVKQIGSGDLTGAMETAKATALALWRGFGLDLAAIWVEIESTGRKVWAGLTEFAASTFDTALGLFRESVFGLVDLLLSIPGVDELLAASGRTPEQIRADSEALLGKSGGESFSTRVGKQFDEINRDRDAELDRIGQERVAIEAELRQSLEAARGETGLASVPDGAKNATQAAGEGIRQFQRDRASLARSTSNAFAASRAANVSSVRKKDTTAEKTAKAAQQTADNTKKLVDQNKTSAVGIPVGA